MNSKSTPKRQLTRLASSLSRAWAAPREFNASVAVLLASGAIAYGLSNHSQAAPPTLPTPCAGGACGRNGANTPFVSSGQLGNNGQPLINGTAMQIKQLSDKAVLNWKDFNIGAGYSVEFVQPNATSATLNRIWSMDPSVIAGNLKANGQIYLLNQNGILFNNGAKVNVGSLTASTLNITDDAFENGVLAGSSAAIANNSNTIPSAFQMENGGEAGLVQVDAGAELTTSSGGRVMLFAPTVINKGTITTPDGQTILGAGQDIILAASTDPAMRGLWIQVEHGGEVSNLGKIQAERGNITLAGLMVNQAGRLSATTSVNANGSIYLVAGEVVDQGFYNSKTGLQPNRGGSLSLAADSVTEIQVDKNDQTTITDKQAFSPSVINLTGKTVALLGNASIKAPGATVNVVAAENPHNFILKSAAGEADNSRIYLDSASSIDVSGLKDVQVSVEKNLIAVELRSNELQDAPLQRGGFLQGKTVYVDINQGTTLTDIQPFKDNIGHTVSEKLSQGGSIKLESQGDVIAKQGSTLNVSGGSIAYQSGYGRATKLLGADGKTYDVSKAPTDIQYIGFADGQTYTDKWGVVHTWNQLNNKRGSPIAGYKQGSDAGTLSVIAPHTVLQGTLSGNTVTGPYQRSTPPLGGQLILGTELGGFFSSSPTASKDFGASNIALGNTLDLLAPDFNFDSSLSNSQNDTATLSVAQIENGGFNRIGLFGNGAISIDANTDLAGGGYLRASGKSVLVNADISIAGGTVNLSAKATTPANFATADTTVTVAAGKTISTQGQWVNDYESIRAGTAVSDNPLINGGSISLTAVSDINLEAGSKLDTSGGGWVSSSKKLSSGKGGGITLNAGEKGDGITLNQNMEPAKGSLHLEGELNSYSLNKGGTLNLTSGQVQIGGTTNSTTTLLLNPEFFTQGGFSAYNVSGRDTLLIAADTVVHPISQNLVFDSAYLNQTSGSSLQDFTHSALLPDQQRTATSLSLSTSNGLYTEVNSLTILPGRGDLRMEAGSSITVDPKASVSLSARENLTIHGRIEAPSGSITLITGNKGPTTGDGGYLANQTLLIGQDARLLATATPMIVTNPTTGRREGEVLDGGSIKLSAQKGYLVTEAGSLLDVSGAAASIDQVNKGVNGTTIQPRTIVGSGGQISLNAREGMVLKGDVAGHAAAVPGAAAGSLNVGFNLFDRTALQSEFLNVLNPYPWGSRTLTLDEHATADLSNSLVSGQAQISTPWLMAGGFDSISLSSTDEIKFAGAVNLETRRAINLDAPLFSADQETSANLKSAYIKIGNSNGDVKTTELPVAGNGDLHLQAQLIDLVGNSVLNGFEQARYQSSGDIRARYSVGNNNNVNFKASLASAGDLTFAAQQVYPATLTDFTISTPGTVTVLPQGEGHGSVPLSAAGTLTINAKDIVQQGTLRAPLGRINLNASEHLVLDAGSLTSVSAEGKTIPFGEIENGKQWIYTLDSTGTSTPIDTLPEKAIDLHAPQAEIKTGATVDLSGGGDLFAYEFTPGPGGSRNVLDSTYAAIVPSLGSNYAPLDYQYGLNSKAGVGDTIYLEGVPGLAKGYYTLMPAQYALLPGAFAVQPLASSYRDLPIGTAIKQNDGSMIVGAYQAVLGTDIQSSRTAGFRLTPEAVIRTQSGFDTTTANVFFSEKALANNSYASRLPVDAGQLQLRTSDSLKMDGTINFAKGSFVSGKDKDGKDITVNGLGGTVAIVAPAITVVDQIDSNLSGLQLQADSLNQLNAASLILGATRNTQADGDHLNVGSNHIALNNSASHTLKASEVILAAKDNVTLKAGSAVEASGGKSTAAESLILEGDGALLRVASGEQATVKRNNLPNTVAGKLEVETGASIKGSGSVLFDAAKDTHLASDVVIDSRAVSVAASQVSLGDVPAQTNGLVVNNTLLDHFSGLDALAIHSYGSIDLYGPVTLGGVDAQGKPVLSHLTLDGSGIKSIGTGQQTLSAANIELRNSGTTSLGNVAASNSTLNLQALDNGKADSGNLVLGQGNFGIGGTSSATLAAARDIRSEGSGSLNVAGDLALQSARITADSGVEQVINAKGAVTITATTQPSGNLADAGINAALTINGSRIQQNGTIILPSGTVTLHATGSTASDDVVIGAGSNTSAAGVAKKFIDVYGYSAAGTIKLASDHGNVRIEDNATLDVSAARHPQKSTEGGEAGSLVVTASEGRFVVDQAHLLGSAPAGKRSGSTQITVAALDNFSAINSAVNAGGFNQAQTYRATSGDVHVAASDSSTARHIEISAEHGALDVAGQLNASSPDKGGSIELWAQNNLTLAAGGKLLANSENGKGGNVTLGSSTGFVDAQANAMIDVQGKSTDGDVLVRASRTGNNADVKVTGLQATILSDKPIIVEAVKVYNNGGKGFTSVGGSGAAAQGNLLLNTNAAGSPWKETADFFSKAASIENRLGTADQAVQVRAGIEIQSLGDLTLASDWDLRATNKPASWRSSKGTPVNLTLKAQGNLIFNGSLSDGFTGSGSDLSQGVLATGDSASYRLVAGSDLNNARANAIKGSTGDIVLNPGKLIRTGNGSIDLNAAHDINLGKVPAVGAKALTSAEPALAQRSVIYTAGLPTATPADYIAPATLDANSKAIIASYPTEGGDISVHAGNDIIAAPTDQLFSNWLWRAGNANNNGKIAAGNANNNGGNNSWWISFADFQQGIGALGGGDVSVISGRDIRNLSVVIPTTGRLTGAVGSDVDANKLLINGGGDLDVLAGRDMLSGIYGVDHGQGHLQAGRSITSGRLASETGRNAEPVYTILGVGNSQFEVLSGKDLHIETVLNPMILPQSRKQLKGADTLPIRDSYFFNYNATDKVSLLSAAGDITFHTTSYQKSIPTSSLFNEWESDLANIYPASLDALALGGGITNEATNRIQLFPSTNGNLNLLATGNINLSKGNITLNEANPDLQASIFRASSSLVGSGTFEPKQLPKTPLHQEDHEPVRVVSSEGSIIGGGNDNLVLPKHALISADVDIRNLWLIGKNLYETDVTQVLAGQDIVYDVSRDVSNKLSENRNGIAISGPGSINVLAGRNIDLGNSAGIVSKGNLDDVRLPDHGATIIAAAGLGQDKEGHLRAPDYQAFIDRYLTPAGPTPAAVNDSPSTNAPYIYTKELTQYMRTRQGDDTLGDADALAAFKQLAPEQQLSFIANTLYQELHTTGVEHNRDGSDYNRGNRAISTLFPTKTVDGTDAAINYAGDINLFFSQIKTTQGGDINLMTPGGSVVVGLAKVPQDLLQSKEVFINPVTLPGEANLGLLVMNEGAIRGFANDDFNINRSRILTLQGGDILLWASKGDIDAGKGAKTASAAPPPVILTDANGNTFVNPSGAVVGSGIGQLLTKTGIEPGTVDLIAPEGEVNAGDAGIRSAGNLNIAALRVVGADNIKVGGLSSGVPLVDSGSLSNSLSGMSAVADTAKSTTEEVTRKIADASDTSQQLKVGFKPTFISVEVTCMGDDCDK